MIVRGARFCTLGPLSNEVVIAPTYVLAENQPEFAHLVHLSGQSAWHPADLP